MCAGLFQWRPALDRVIARPSLLTVMFKTHWKAFIGFVVLMTALSTVVVQYGVDVQFRGYPLPFLTIESGIGNKPYLGWRVFNLLLSLGLCATAATTALAASRLRVAARKWLLAGLGLAAIIGVTAYCLWNSVDAPITRPDSLNHAVTVSAAMRHLLAVGTLASAVCFFVFFLKTLLRIRSVESSLEPL